MPFTRNLPERLIASLVPTEFWKNISSDRELQPEIRNDSITVYYQGRALVRELKLQKNSLVASVHHKFVPLRRTAQDIGLRWSAEDGLVFKNTLSPQSLGIAAPETIAAYKRLMGHEAGREDVLQQRIMTNPKNRILDQQVAFEGERRNKIDLCYFNPSLKKLCFGEIKRCDDPRLSGPLPEPEVIQQLRRYGTWIQREAATISTAYRRVVELKRVLGLSNRLEGVPATFLPVLTKPVLIIGDCKDADVERILGAQNGQEIDDKWSPLWHHLQDVAAGLILCGKDGCSLRELGGEQRQWFE